MQICTFVEIPAPESSLHRRGRRRRSAAGGAATIPRPSIDWRASLVPAAAVILTPIAYIKVVAVKKFVVGFLPRTTRAVARGGHC